MTIRNLRDLIDEKIDGQWSQWSKAHPNLAEAIDRARLIESSVELLRNDPDYIEAMRSAGLDEAKLAAAASILNRADQIIRRALSL
jgi:hypothetical protein